MKEHPEPFTPEQIDEQIERILQARRSRHGGAQPAEQALVEDLLHVSRFSDEQEERSLARGWQRIVERRRTNAFIPEQPTAPMTVLPGTYELAPAGTRPVRPEPHRRRSLAPWATLIAALLLVAVLAGGLLTLLHGVRTPNTSNSPTPQSTQVVSPTGLYVLDYYIVYKLDFKTGVRRWQYRLNALGTQLFIANDTLYVSTHSSLVVLDVANGTLRWKKDFTGTIMVQVVGDAVVVGEIGANARMYDVVSILNGKDGSPRLRIERANAYYMAVAQGLLYLKVNGYRLQAFDVEKGQLRWLYSEPGAPTTPPTPFATTLAGDTLYDGSGSTLYALDALNGTVRWQKQVVRGRTVVKVQAGDNMVCAEVITSGAATSPVIVTLAAHSGMELWRTATDYILESALDPINGLVFVEPRGVNSGMLYALDARSGRQRWTYRLRNCQGAVCDGVYSIFTGDKGLLSIFKGTGAGGSLAVLDSTTGKVRWSRAVAYNSTGFTAAMLNGTLYIVGIIMNGTNNYIHAYNLADGRERWQYQLAFSPGGEETSAGFVLAVP